MPLFKRRGQEEKPDDEPAASSRVLNQQEILDRLEEEIFRAERYGRALIVLCVRPQRLSGENISDTAMTQAGDAIVSGLRFSDRVGRLDEETLAVVLPETSGDVARVIAQKLATELAVRGPSLGHARWFVGASAFPDDGADPSAMVLAAFERARE